MSSSTALLPKPKKDDHPIFLRVCHSPWLGITQKGLLYARGVTFLYLVGSFATVLFYDFKYTDKEWLVAFELSKLSYVLQIIYSGIVTVRTLTLTAFFLSLDLSSLTVSVPVVDIHASTLPSPRQPISIQLCAHSSLSFSSSYKYHNRQSGFLQHLLQRSNHIPICGYNYPLGCCCSTLQNPRLSS